MNKRIRISLAIAIAILAMTITFSITMIVSMKMFDSTVTSVKEKETMYNKLAEIDQNVRDNYYGAIDENTLYDMLGAGYMAGIGDKYAKYYTASQYANYLNEVSGKLMGIGVDVVKDATGYARVTKVYADSPASEAGLQENTYITSVDGTDVKPLSDAAVRLLLQGEEGTAAQIGTMSADFTTTNAVDLVRRSYRIPSVSGAMVGRTGYIRIMGFNKDTPSEFDSLVQQYVSNGITGFVLDVRDTKSGDIENAVRVLDCLCPETAVGNAVYRNGDTVSLGTTSGETETDLPIVLVTNAATAGPAELFCVTLRDVLDARIVGSRTAGRGGIQKIIEQTDGSALEFTVATVCPANPDSTYHEVGITPDIEIMSSEGEAASSAEMTVGTDPQLLRAFKLLGVMTGEYTADGLQEELPVTPNTGDEPPKESGDAAESPAEGEENAEPQQEETPAEETEAEEG